MDTTNGKQEESLFMKEYVVYLCHPGESILILALNFAEAYEIAYERWAHERVVQIVLHSTPPERVGGSW